MLEGIAIEGLFLEICTNMHKNPYLIDFIKNNNDNDEIAHFFNTTKDISNKEAFCKEYMIPLVEDINIIKEGI